MLCRSDGKFLIPEWETIKGGKTDEPPSCIQNAEALGLLVKVSYIKEGRFTRHPLQKK